MRALLQPDQTELCGQASVAMVAGVSLDEAIKACGNSCLGNLGSTIEEIKRGLSSLGISYGRAIPGFRKIKGRNVPTRIIPKFAIASVDDNSTRWAHMVVILDGQVYDPGIGTPLPLRVYENFIIERAFSRRYKRPRDGHKRVKARWGYFLPILSIPIRDTVVREAV
jgi:hypothetical protein